MYKRVPQELKELRQWVLYDQKKIPIAINGGMASTTNPATWSGFGEVVAEKGGKAKGIGFVFTADDSTLR